MTDKNWRMQVLLVIAGIKPVTEFTTPDLHKTLSDIGITVPPMPNGTLKPNNRLGTIIQMAERFGLIVDTERVTRKRWDGSSGQPRQVWRRTFGTLENAAIPPARLQEAAEVLRSHGAQT